MSYHKIMAMAVERIFELRKGIKDPFADSWTDASYYTIAFEGTESFQFVNFYQNLDSATLSFLEHQLLDSSHDATKEASEYVLSQIVGQALTTITWEEKCPICYHADGDRIIRSLMKREDVGHEFLVRIAQMNRHLRDRTHWDLDVWDQVDMENTRLVELSYLIHEKAEVTMKSMDLYEAMPLSTKTHACFTPDNINHRIIMSGTMDYRDCLGRSSTLQWLDSKVNGFEEEDMEFFKDVTTSENINLQDVLGRSLLHASIQKNWVPAVAHLLELGADVGLETIYGSLALHFAALKGHFEICELLIAHSRADRHLNHLDCQGNAALYYAIGRNNIEIVKLFLSGDKKLNPNACAVDKGPPPLIKAIYVGNDEMVDLLLQNGANPRIIFYGHTAFYYAVRMRHIGIMRLLGAKTSTSTYENLDVRAQALRDLQEIVGEQIAQQGQLDIEFPINRLGQ
ncbi:ankyrin [Corynespora cassiicola Philippines]|uniref:Ankyrin n=1 Tax=Corynespora cassiicola Philippines TaxID=1448308 RepID=A0A2T2N433_CORCC|nr:ankyrin [Corynespora cassiicola Philippines]